VSLVDVVGTACPAYAALSHCWGSNLEGYKTTSTNLQQRRLGIDVQSLSPTFKDAIEICCRLQIRFVWIDALCIVQDSVREWNTESVIMGDIYQNAVFTISASHAHDGLGGCFSSTSGPGSDEDLVVITNPEADTGEHTNVLIRSRKPGYVPAPDLEDSPLGKRGWVYQERLLSSRIVHFAATQAIWECRHMLLQQRLHPVAGPTVPSQARLGPVMHGGDAVRHWHTLVQDYSARAFTRYEDRLVALAGVAQICSPRINARYLAGLWSSHFAYGLSWHSTGVASSRPAMEGGPRHPTWSWASWNYGVTWEGRELAEFGSAPAGFVLEKAALDLHETARREFSPVKSCPITVRGRAAPIKYAGSVDFVGKCDIRLGNLLGHVTLDEPSRLAELSGKASRAVVLGLGWFGMRKEIHFIAIVPAGEGTDMYVRVGMGRAFFEPADDSPFGDDHATETFTIM
jgi:hypothetical protein